MSFLLGPLLRAGEKLAGRIIHPHPAGQAPDTDVQPGQQPQKRGLFGGIVKSVLQPGGVGRGILSGLFGHRPKMIESQVTDGEGRPMPSQSIGLGPVGLQQLIGELGKLIPPDVMSKLGIS